MSARTAFAWLAALGWLIPLDAQQYVGAAVCAKCHPAQWKRQSESGHAFSLRRPGDHPLAELFLPSSPLTRPPNFRYLFTREGQQLAVRVTGGEEGVELPLEWAFGAGGQAVTFVSQVDEDNYVEHYLSYYSATKGLESTPGQQGMEVGRLPAALGVFYRTFDPEPKIMRCFGCHSTGQLTLGTKFDIRPAELGVRCESCHGPGRRHLEAVGRGQIDAARKLIRNPGRLPAEELNQLCGNCHRKPAPSGDDTNWKDPWNARHQPVYLHQSACFQKSAGKLSCVTCHSPHEPLVTNNPGYYNAKCIGCHGGPKFKHPRLRTSAKLEDCVGCHMPLVRPRPELRFANHWIGVYKEGEALRPAR